MQKIIDLHCDAIANDLAKLEKLRWMGTRYMTLTHSKNLKWAASSGESECEFEGLTPFGEKVIAAMNLSALALILMACRPFRMACPVVISIRF